MVRVLKATTRAEEYELRAKYLWDDYQLSGDGPLSADFRIRKVMRLVPFSPQDKVLDISPGRGLLFERIRDNVAECKGHDISSTMVERVKKKFAGYPNVSFTCGSASTLPYPDNYFDKVLMTSAFCLQETKKECMQTLAEIRRVAKDTARIFISDIHVVDESTLPREQVRPVQRLVRRFAQDGILRFPLSVVRYAVQRIRVRFELEPLLVESEWGLWIPHDEFVEMCRQNRLEAHGFPTEEITGTSKSRWDYRITPR